MEKWSLHVLHEAAVINEVLQVDHPARRSYNVRNRMATSLEETWSGIWPHSKKGGVFELKPGSRLGHTANPTALTHEKIACTLSDSA